MKDIFFLNLFKTNFLYGKDKSKNKPGLATEQSKKEQPEKQSKKQQITQPNPTSNEVEKVKKNQFPTNLEKDKPLKVMQVDELYFLNFFSLKKKKFFTRKVDYFFTENWFINFAIKNKKSNLVGVWIFDVLEAAINSNDSILIVGNQQKDENQIRHQFNIIYGKSSSLFFFSRELLQHSHEKVKIFIEKSNPKIVILDKSIISKNYSIINNIHSSLLLINLDISNLYLKKRDNYIIHSFRYLLFFPVYIFYFILIKLNYNHSVNDRWNKR